MKQRVLFSGLRNRTEMKHVITFKGRASVKLIGLLKLKLGCCRILKLVKIMSIRLYFSSKKLVYVPAELSGAKSSFNPVFD